ncbi:DEAD/DEAH box helicase family protein [Jeotgalibaca sp. MA1X17-3]|uniref:DEAD/DEAH box helicase n=1 Tax=Jeotgalibaca sp. MA1X17-3 TaxID=2908211 RepID=UPI001F3E2AA8|nr:type ISP restriction/modification enzyme [Jeotgalibaca sp. MA1X17-3]UJF15962.1 DEAD/DEAH box helicase family protein [Jeotgalibaca sp. MA1X17-3]
MSDKEQYKSFIELMNEIDEHPREQRDRGTLFEHLVKAYLTYEPMYQQLFDEVWLLHEVPEEYGISRKDTGTDLVAINHQTKELTAIQAKYYSEDTSINKGIIDSFLNEVGKTVYSNGIIITSTDNWTNNAEEALNDRSKPITRISLSQLRDSRVDWSAYSFSKPEEVVLQVAKTPRKHQKEAIQKVVDGFKEVDRGKLIMAPGTGKTYTSLQIAEEMLKDKKEPLKVLYLVPSIQLLSQSLRGWSGDTRYQMETLAVCSDRKVTKGPGGTELEDIAASDIGFPATTDYQRLLKYQTTIEESHKKFDMLVVFSTYHSTGVIQQAQAEGFYEFDLIIADEAHRTTGIRKENEEGSPFVKVHNNDLIKGKKRLYQTATPRVYGDNAKQKAEEMSVVIADMNDPTIYGEEFFRLGFGEAVHQGILTDYKVMVLAVDESMVQTQMQKIFSQKSNELEFNDVTKIIGCWNGLLKRKSDSNELYGEPMKRAIAFTGTIAQSKLIKEKFNEVVNEYLDGDDDAQGAFRVEIDHADGSMNALEKNKKIDWLKSEVPDRTCRILSNARFLTEGVDVPDLDAVMFLQPRRSTIDIAQAVGRVMRKTIDKNYGYVILPVGVPSGVNANDVLDNNEKYAVVWEVLNALRSIDERFDAMINKIELNKKKPKPLDVIGVGEALTVNEDDGKYQVDEKMEQVALDFTEDELTALERAIYAKIVQKVGNTRYWESWSKDVAELAQQHITRINAMIESEPETSTLFYDFLDSLRYNINDSITNSSAIEMLAQHVITKPVFDSLFEEESFALNNPVSQAMNKMVLQLEKLGFNNDQKKLEGFYESVRVRSEGIDNLEAKQTIIVQLYENFFKVGFPHTTDSLGIVFTPLEVVDFIINSVNDILKKYFSKELSDENVNFLDPFTGTGTFITRLLQSGHIRKEDLVRKYRQEIFANEIVLLSYYIAAINIEQTFKEVSNSDKYLPFEGIVLTDTFESTEHENILEDNMFGDNIKRLKRQKESPITVILGNPPYYSKQESNNNDNQKNQYPSLDRRISDTYVEHSTATNKQVLYDSYVRSLRWASDRIKGDGIIGFVINGSFIDGSSTDGIRKVFHEEFQDIFIVNLRGNTRTSGEYARKEGGQVFGSGSRATITMVFLIKNSKKLSHNIHYAQVDDYMSREDKMKQIISWNSIVNMEFQEIIPNKLNDWINQRGIDKNSVVIGSKVKSEKEFIFDLYSRGLATARDGWSVNFSKKKVKYSMKNMINYYNEKLKSQVSINKLMNRQEIKWSRSLIKDYNSAKSHRYEEDRIFKYMYRPYTKKYVYYTKEFVDMQYLLSQIYPEPSTKNFGIVMSGKTGTKDFTALMIDTLPDLNIYSGGAQFFPRFRCSNKDSYELLYDKDTINLDYLSQMQRKLDKNITAEDVVYYVYGILHSKEYIEKNKINLKKELPKIPFSNNYDLFIELGKELAYLHMNYEEVNSYEGIVVNKKVDEPSYKVNKMKFGRGKDKTTIIFNNDITIHNIPERAYEYIVNGRPAIEWIMNQYQIKIDKQSGIIDDPNEYSENPKYILNLLLSVISVAVQTVDLVEKLPSLDIFDEVNNS